MLNPHDDVLSRGEFDNVEDNVEVVDLSINEPSIEGLDGTPNIDHVKKIVDGRDPPTECDPLDGSSIRPVPPSLLSRQGLNPLGGVIVPNGTPLYGVIPPKGNIVILSDSSHSITKRKIANTAIKRKIFGWLPNHPGRLL